jgi:hypothetical protein
VFSWQIRLRRNEMRSEGVSVELRAASREIGALTRPVL